jgi:hypothetical protein
VISSGYLDNARLSGWLDVALMASERGPAALSGIDKKDGEIALAIELDTHNYSRRTASSYYSHGGYVKIAG